MFQSKPKRTFASYDILRIRLTVVLSVFLYRIALLRVEARRKFPALEQSIERRATEKIRDSQSNEDSSNRAKKTI